MPLFLGHRYPFLEFGVGVGDYRTKIFKIFPIQQALQPSVASDSLLVRALDIVPTEFDRIFPGLIQNVQHLVRHKLVATGYNIVTREVQGIGRWLGHNQEVKLRMIVVGVVEVEILHNFPH
jgi:hypothetical protein